LQCHYMQLYSFRLESRIDRARFNLIDGTETDDEDANEIIESWEKPVPDSRMPESFVFGDNTKNIAKIVTPETMKAAMRLDEMQEMKHPDKAIPDSFKIIDDGEVAGHVALKVSDPTKLWPFPTGSRGFIGKSKDSK